MSILYVALGGFAGSIIRYFLSNLLNPDKRGFPRGTIFVNLSGSLVLGLLMGMMPASNWILFMGTGFLGSYTTFSTCTIELIQQLENKQYLLFSLYFFLSYACGILLAFFGYLLGTYMQ